MDRVPADSFSPKYMTNSMLQNAPDTYIIRNPHRITLLRKRTYNPHRITFLAKKAGGGTHRAFLSYLTLIHSYFMIAM